MAYSALGAGHPARDPKRGLRSSGPGGEPRPRRRWARPRPRAAHLSAPGLGGLRAAVRVARVRPPPSPAPTDGGAGARLRANDSATPGG